jgi:hypothetical protein
MRGKKGRIVHVELPPGSPSWDDVRNMLWGEIERGAKAGLTGFKTIKKVLLSHEYDK